MSRDHRSSDPGSRPSRKIIWILGAIFIAVLIVLAFNGLVRGGGEAVGVNEAAPGDTNADRPAENGADPPAQ